MAARKARGVMGGKGNPKKNPMPRRRPVAEPEDTELEDDELEDDEEEDDVDDDEEEEDLEEEDDDEEEEEPAPKKSKAGHDPEKRKRFKKIAPKRLDKAIAGIKLVGNCGNRASYAYSEKEVAQIVQFLRDAVDGVEEAYQPKSKAHEGVGFVMDD